MSEYTPTTDEVEDYYAHGQFADPAMSEHDHAKAFRRWLAEVERAAAARALAEIAKDSAALEEAAREGMNSRGGPYPWNAAKGVRDMLRARAAEYRKAVQ